MNRTRRVAIAVATLSFWCGAIFGATGFANAQDWPSRPVKFIVPLGPGSGTDIGARLIAEQLTRLWGQSVVVENRIGGDGIVGINAFIAAHDNHTLLYMPTSSFVAHPYQHEKLPYDPTELSPVARITNTYVGLVLSPSLNAATVADLIAAARTQPGRIRLHGPERWPGRRRATNRLGSGTRHFERRASDPGLRFGGDGRGYPDDSNYFSIRRRRGLLLFPFSGIPSSWFGARLASEWRY